MINLAHSTQSSTSEKETTTIHLVEVPKTEAAENSPYYFSLEGPVQDAENAVRAVFSLPADSFKSATDHSMVMFLCNQALSFMQEAKDNRSEMSQPTGPELEHSVDVTKKITDHDISSLSINDLHRLFDWLDARSGPGFEDAARETALDNMSLVADVIETRPPQNEDDLRRRAEVLARWALRAGDFHKAATTALEASAGESRSLCWPALEEVFNGSLTLSQLIDLHGALGEVETALLGTINCPCNHPLGNVLGELWELLIATRSNLADTIAQSPASDHATEHRRLSLALKHDEGDECRERTQEAIEKYFTNTRVATS